MGTVALQRLNMRHTRLVALEIPGEMMPKKICLLVG